MGVGRGEYLWEMKQVDVDLRDLHGTQQVMVLSSWSLFLGAAGMEVVLGSMGNSGPLEETSSSCLPFLLCPFLSFHHGNWRMISLEVWLKLSERLALQDSFHTVSAQPQHQAHLFPSPHF